MKIRILILSFCLISSIGNTQKLTKIINDKKTNYNEKQKKIHENGNKIFKEAKKWEKKDIWVGNR